MLIFFAGKQQNIEKVTVTIVAFLSKCVSCIGKLKPNTVKPRHFFTLKSYYYRTSKSVMVVLL